MRQRREKVASVVGWRRIGLLLCVLVGVCPGSCLREDELRCEDAVSHIVGCCPGTSSQYVACEYNFGVCNSTVPGLSVESSRCIVTLGCEQIRESYLCGGTGSLGCGSYL